MNIVNKLADLLNLEAREFEIHQDENSYQFEFDRKKYLIIVELINKENQINDIVGSDNHIIHNLSFSENFYQILNKSMKSDLIFGYFIYDEQKEIFIHYKNDNIDNLLKSTNSSLQEIDLGDLESKGINLFIGDDQHSTIQFKTKYFAIFLKSYFKEILEFMNHEELMCFDWLYNLDDYSNIEEKISRLEDLDFFPTQQKPKREKWDRDEYIICLDLYFKVKDKFVKDKKNDPEILKVYQTLKNKSLIQNRITRTVDAVYMRLQNYKHVDPEWDVKGLSGGGLKCSEIFEEFVRNRIKLSEEVERINALYNLNNQESSSNFSIRKYQQQDENYTSKINIEFLDLEEINNLKDRATKQHKITLNVLFNHMNSLNFECFECPKTFDLLAVGKNESILFEVKSLNEDNFVSQTRSAFFQIQFYEFLHKQKNSLGFDRSCKKVILFSESPQILTNKNTFETYKMFCTNYGIELWFVDKGLIIHD